MIIEVVITISSIIGLLGYLIEHPIMFYSGGTISFIGFARYIILGILQKDRISIQKIQLTGSFQRNKWSSVYSASNENELHKLVKQFMISNLISRAIVYLLAFGLFYWLFSWNAFIWIGIAFGLFYILEIRHSFKTNSTKNIITYRNDSTGVFCHIKLRNGERLFISCTQSSVKMGKLLFGYFPVATIYNGNLEEALKLFSDPEHWGQSILDLIIEKFVNFNSITEIRENIAKLKLRLL